jgi:hypothetical protein
MIEWIEEYDRALSRATETNRPLFLWLHSPT